MKSFLTIGIGVLSISVVPTAEARFLSNDPVTMTDADLDPRYFNRYAYSFNNPINNIDPDGRRVRSIGNHEQTAVALGYLSKSPTFEAQYSTIVNSSKTYFLNVGPNVSSNSFTPSLEGGTISVNTTQGLVNGAGEVSSPASSLGHEVAHAAQRDGSSLYGYQKNSETRSLNGTTPVYGENGQVVGEQPNYTYGTSVNEAGATEVQNQINTELGEPTRQNYHDSSRVTTCGVTSTDTC